MPVAIHRLTSERRSDRDLVYLLTLAGKYGLEPRDLHEALAKAKRGGKSVCGALSIDLRHQEGSRLFFMFSDGERPVAQAAISEDTLGRFRDVPPELKVLLKKSDSNSASDSTRMERRIADLKIGLRRVCLKAKVMAKSEVRAIESRNGTPLVLCLATLSDGTGQIRLPLWNDWINSVAENDTVIIRGATVNNFRGEMQLSLPWRTGTISTVQDKGAQ